MDTFHLNNLHVSDFPRFPQWQPFYYPCPYAMPPCPNCGGYHPLYPIPYVYPVTYGSNVENNNATPNPIQNQGCPSVSTQGQTNSCSSL